MKLKIEVFSHYLFEETCKNYGLNDENVELKKDSKFIDIIGTDECIKYWIQEDDKHFFKDHVNVLNLEFDDITENVLYNGHLFKTMNMEQAERVVEFIEDINKVNTAHIRICCKAGMSRSRAFGEFIYRYCKENGIEVDYEDRDEYTTMLNYGVLNRLEHAYKKKHKLDEYAEDGKDYPDELVNPPVRIINRERNMDAYKMNKQN